MYSPKRELQRKNDCSMFYEQLDIGITQFSICSKWHSKHNEDIYRNMMFTGGWKISNLVKCYFKSSRFAVLQGKYFIGYFVFLHDLTGFLLVEIWVFVLQCSYRSDTQLPPSVLKNIWVILFCLVLFLKLYKFIISMTTILPVHFSKGW